MPHPTPHQKRDRQLNIALRQDEQALLQARADACGLRLVEFARAALLNKRVAAYSAGLPSRLERLNLEQLKRIGNNLNQIARFLNTYQLPPPPDLEACLQAIRSLISDEGRA